MQPKLLEHLYDALRSEHGKELRVSGQAKALRQQLYRARTEANDDALKVLSFVVKDDDTVWIVKR